MDEAKTYYKLVTNEDGKQRVDKVVPLFGAKKPEGYQEEPIVLPSDKLKQVKADALITKNAAVAAGTVTSVRGIVMQCGEYDTLLLSMSPIKTFVRDIDNVVHAVTEYEFGKILNDVKNAYAAILMTYWDTVDKA